eukprot:838111-Pelagomonas_calceolata.AAC.2
MDYHDLFPLQEDPMTGPSSRVNKNAYICGKGHMCQQFQKCKCSRIANAFRCPGYGRSHLRMRVAA